MKLPFLFLVALLFASTAHAWEFPRNPDRFPSFGFNVANSNLSGSRAEIDQPNDPVINRTIKSSEQQTFYSIGGDVRLPVAENLTVNMFYTSASFDSDFTRAGSIYKQASKLSGQSYGLGLRLYLN